jgi:hypothetical protein
MNYKDEYRDVERNAFWTLPRVLLFALFCLVALYALGFAATGGNLAIYRFWAPKQADAERVVFQNTQSFVQGKAEFINQLRLAYETADGAQKEALRQSILTEASTVDNSKLPVDEQIFIRSLR